MRFLVKGSSRRLARIRAKVLCRVSGHGSDAVMAAQEDLVEVVHTLKQIVCVKG